MAAPKIPNQPDNLRMGDFRSYSDMYGGLIRSARFAVQIQLAGNNVLRQLDPSTINFTRDLTYLCEAAELPGRGSMTLDLRYYGPSFKVPYQTTYEDITLTFLCRTEMRERQFFDDWMEMINPSLSYDFRYRDEYAAEIKIFQFGESDNKKEPIKDNAPEAQYLMTLADAYPILVNPQPVTWADDNFLRLGVTFTYSKWWRARDGQPKPYGSPADYELVAGRTV